MNRAKRFETSQRRAPDWRGRFGSWVPRVLGAGAAGVMSAIAWLPPHYPVLLVLGLTTILYAHRSARGWKEAAVVGFLGSTLFFLIINRPLVSAHVWGGWANDGEPTVGSSAWWLLTMLWILLSLWGALFWTAVLAFYRRLRADKAWLRVLGIATVWAGIAEGLRSVSTWGFEWGFLGFALADVSALRQWSSVGGVLLLSSLVVGASALLVELLTTKARQKLLAAGATFVIAVTVWLAGTALESDSGEQGGAEVSVAAFQFAPPVPPAGTTVLGVSPDWFSALPQIIERGYRLIVLPESIASHAVQLDGIPAASLGTGRQVHADRWKDALAPLLPDPDTFVVVGVEGAEQGSTYNSTSVWNRDGLVGWQHKVNLVPFAEYLPRGWRFLEAQSLTYYRAGERYRTIDAGPFRLGSFICQEVQHAGTARELTRRGANILVTGGNDGVFADRRVARVHHSMTRVRATEVGRPIVRAMKSGITSIVSPSGDVLGRSPGEEPALVANRVSLRTNQTLWTRVGALPVLLATIGCLAYLARSFHRGRGQH